jgi:hypothetical protein
MDNVVVNLETLETLKEILRVQKELLSVCSDLRNLLIKYDNDYQQSLVSEG